MEECSWFAIASVGGLPMSFSHSHEPVNCVKQFMLRVFSCTMHVCLASPRFNQPWRNPIRWVTIPLTGVLQRHAVANESSQHICEPLALWSTLEGWYWSVSWFPWLNFADQQRWYSWMCQDMSHNQKLRAVFIYNAECFWSEMCTKHYKGIWHTPQKQ